ncbi:hypothetical protein DXG01_001675 [Tephrocybe rancida]|nr:hypothetical protein DXG01_001675 [Tephrocybe rancida]
MSWFSRAVKKPSKTHRLFQLRDRPSDETPDKWELNEEFFSALSKWTLDHPERRLETLLKSANDAIDQGKELLEVIPDAPFPVRGFIKSVLCLFRLGVNISIAQRDVKEFALDILHWVNGIKESFEQAGIGRFTAMTWVNLSRMRDLIDEICTWAADRLVPSFPNDKRWSLQNLKVKGEIEDFRGRMDEARKLFNDQSLIVVSGGLSAIYQLLWTVLFVLIFGQNAMVTALENLKGTLDSQFKQIVKDQERRRFLEDELQARTIKDPSFPAQNKKTCRPGTRDKIIQEIKDWINDQDVSQNFLWIVGPPGCGKSALAASIAEHCQSQKYLGAQYFINHANNNTTNPLYYFPTVIRDLYKRSDSVEQHLHDTLKEQKSSVDTPEKAAQLFLNTIEQAAREHPDSPVVVIFDGLDETSSYDGVSDETRREHLENTAAIFSALFTKLSHQRNAKILISSRPEAEILRQFRDSAHGQHIKELNICTDDEDSHHDIKLFLGYRLGQIAKKYLSPSVEWPKVEHLEQLAERASGLFIWAVTVCNYIDASLRLRGKEDPDAVFVEFKEEDLTDLAKLYMRVLTLSYTNPAANKWTFETFRRIMGAIMVVQQPMNIRDLSALLDLRQTPRSGPIDLMNFFDNLRTLLVPDSGEVNEMTIPQAHKSFFDFLAGGEQLLPVHFRININTANAEMALLCLRHLIAAYSDIHATHYASTESDLRNLSAPTFYSVQFLLSHIPHQDRDVMGIVSDHPHVQELSQLEDILRYSSHKGFAGPLAFSVQSEHSLVRTSFDTRSLLWNHEDASATSPIKIKSRNWLDVRFLPEKSRIFTSDNRSFPSKNASLNGLRALCMQKPSYDLENSPSLMSEPTPRRWQASFNGEVEVRSTPDGLVSLISSESGLVLLELPRRHVRYVTALHISHQGSYIASASELSVEIWDLKKGCYINEPDSMQHESELQSVALSPDETLIVSSTAAQVYLWEVLPCRRFCSIAFEAGGQDSTVFSPDSRLVLGGSKSGTVHLWNARTGSLIREWKVADGGLLDGGVKAVGFRSCGNIAFTCCRDSLHIWDVHQARLLRTIDCSMSPRIHYPVFTADGCQLLIESLAGSTRTSTSFLRRLLYPRIVIFNLAPILLNSTSTFKPKWTTLSPRGNLVVSSAGDQILCWRLDASKVVGDPLEGVSKFVNVVAFSPDESRIVGASEDGVLYLWRSTTSEFLSSLPVPGASSLSFSPDGDYIVATCSNNQSVVLSVRGDELAVSSDEEMNATVVQKLPTSLKSAFFDTTKRAVTFGAEPATRNRRLDGVRWYPSKSDLVVWAYVDGHIVRAGKDGSVVVVPVGDA